MTAPVDSSNRTPRRLINIAPDRVPEFRNQSRADRELSENLRHLNRFFTAERQRVVEQAEEALQRLGFIRDTQSSG